jgi:hypothetical protein
MRDCQTTPFFLQYPLIDTNTEMYGLHIWIFEVLYMMNKFPKRFLAGIR